MDVLPVAHIIGALPYGGVERNLVRILPLLDRTRFEPFVVCLREKGEMAPLLEEAGVSVTLVHQKSRYHPGSLWRLARFLRERKTAILHCHMRRANTSGRLAGMFARVPVRLAHERDLGLGKNRRHYCIDRLLARWNGPILCVTRGVAEHNSSHSGLPLDRFLVQYNGIELEPFLESRDRSAIRRRLGLPPDRPVIGAVGRLARVKRLPLLLRAFRRLADTTPEPLLALVGEGREGEELRALASGLGLDERVLFLPFQSEIHELYAALDVVAFTSESEGIANVQMEALAAGVPLVSTRVGLAAEAFAEGKEYIAVEGTEESIAQGLAMALDPALRDRLRAAGRERVRDFSLEKQKENLERLYLRLWQEACEKKGRGEGAA